MWSFSFRFQNQHSKQNLLANCFSLKGRFYSKHTIKNFEKLEVRLEKKNSCWNKYEDEQHHSWDSLNSYYDSKFLFYCFIPDFKIQMFNSHQFYMDKYLLKSENTVSLPDFSHPLIHWGIIVSISNSSS